MSLPQYANFAVHTVGEPNMQPCIATRWSSASIIRCRIYIKVVVFKWRFACQQYVKTNVNFLLKMSPRAAFIVVVIALITSRLDYCSSHTVSSSLQHKPLIIETITAQLYSGKMGKNNMSKCHYCHKQNMH